MPTTIRDLREQKNLSQDKVAEAAGLTYSAFTRIEAGSGKTTPEEVQRVMDILKGMEPGTRKLAGRPFKDPARQAAVKAARESGGSVAEAISGVAQTPDPAPAKKARKPLSDLEKALRNEKARERRAAKKAAAE